MCIQPGAAVFPRAPWHPAPRPGEPDRGPRGIDGALADTGWGGGGVSEGITEMAGGRR
jgi:hypothetical protein